MQYLWWQSLGLKTKKTKNPNVYNIMIFCTIGYNAECQIGQIYCRVSHRNKHLIPNVGEGGHAQENGFHLETCNIVKESKAGGNGVPLTSVRSRNYDTTFEHNKTASFSVFEERMALQSLHG